MTSSLSPGAIDQGTAAVLVENHRRFLAFLQRRVPSREIAEDILQDAFVRGLTRAPDLATSESVMAWFYRVLRNAIVDYYRRAGVEERAIERYAAETNDTVDPVDAELFDTVCDCVRSLVSTLKPEYAAAINRVSLDGISPSAFAAETGISANNAGVRLHRAHKALKERVREVCNTCADHGCSPCSCKPHRSHC
ncbi:MAG: sigma-70 family RNA polymerase sigma factor [Acidobacteria bacterium]|nr:sigma-70 family RNA polymerase sigma factor [Acidobacteriota bacterium]